MVFVKNKCSCNYLLSRPPPAHHRVHSSPWVCSVGPSGSSFPLSDTYFWLWRCQWSASACCTQPWGLQNLPTASTVARVEGKQSGHIRRRPLTFTILMVWTQPHLDRLGSRLYWGECEHARLDFLMGSFEDLFYGCVVSGGYNLYSKCQKWLGIPDLPQLPLSFLSECRRVWSGTSPREDCSQWSISLWQAGHRSLPGQSSLSASSPAVAPVRCTGPFGECRILVTASFPPLHCIVT